MSTVSTAVLPCPSRTAMALLGSGVPLSLLLDLVLGPRSAELLAAERVPSPRLPSTRSLPSG